MTSTLLAPPPVVAIPETEAPTSDHDNGNGFGGGNFEDPPGDPGDRSDSDPQRWATPLSAYRVATWFAIFSILSVFATLTRVLETRWVHSKDWVSISLPPVLYVNTIILLLSSVTIELARTSAKLPTSKRCSRWLLATLVLGFGFVAGQLVAWRELVSRGLYVASNPGSFFFYLLTAAHGIHLLGGILVLLFVVLAGARLAKGGKQPTAVRAVALYWHFMDGLWLYVLALLFMTIQR